MGAAGRLGAGLLGLAAWTGLVGLAHGQAAELQPSDALLCLQHTQGKGQQPDYPDLEFNANQGARVQVEMHFTRPDRAPEVSILLQEASPPFVTAVLDHVRQLRVPCLVASGGSARIKQDFVFSTDRRRVHWSTPEDSNAAQRGMLWRCVVHPSGARAPEYPLWARRQELQGRVLVRLRFTGSDTPPAVEVFARPSAQGLAELLSEWAKDLRLPCHSGEPLTFTPIYQFLMEDSRYGFKDLTFRQFLANVKGIQQQVLLMDTTTMGCPFDVRLNYRRPLLANLVGEVGPSNPARRPLLEWMATAELDVRRNSADSIFAADAKITIPCLKIDLKPQEKS